MSEHLRPVVISDPQQRFGSPHVKGAPVASLIERVWAGDSVTDVADDYGMRREDVLVSCWYIARHGEGDGLGLRTKVRWAWQAWLAEHTTQFHHGDWANVSDPPSRDQASRADNHPQPPRPEVS